MRQRITKLIATATLLSVCGSAYGQAEVWACQSIERAGLYWENGSWNSTRFVPVNYMIKVDRMNSSIQSNGETQHMTCNSVPAFPAEVQCLSRAPGTNFLLNTETNLGALSYLIGGTVTGAVRDSLSVSALQCTKF
jgi:hypothetical protein